MATEDRSSPEDFVNPWTVTASSNKGIDYAKLIDKFGSSPINEEMVARFERVTGKPAHHFLKRGVFFSHREMGRMLDLAEKGKKFFLYTGRGPSHGAMHMGHLVPFIFTKWLQEVFDVPLVIQLTDDEKYIFKDLTLEHCYAMGKVNAKEIIACGFDQQKTFIFSDLDIMGTHFYKTVLGIQKNFTYGEVKAGFGFDDSTSTGRIVFPTVQAAPVFSASFGPLFDNVADLPCLVTCSLDQDPSFCLARQAAGRLSLPSPSLLHCLRLPPLGGSGCKTGPTEANTYVLLSDTAKQIKNKVNKYAFSGGQVSKEEQIELGADIAVDVSCMYLRFFMEDEERFQTILKQYSEGHEEMLTGHVKKECIQVLQDLVASHQESLAKVTEEQLLLVMSQRGLVLPHPHTPNTGDVSADIADLSLTSESPVFVDPLENLPYTMAFTETSTLREKFGTSSLGPELLARLEAVTSVPAHRLLRRGVVCSHRSLERILQRAESKQPFYIHARAPRHDLMHAGDLANLHFTKWLQDVFRAPVVISLADDDQFLHTEAKLPACREGAKKVARHVLACGFDPALTHVFSTCDVMGGQFYENVLRIQKHVTFNQVRGIFGFDSSSSLGKISFPAVQAAPSFSDSFGQMLGAKTLPCLIPCAIDQDPYFRMTRDVAPRIGLQKPSLLHSTFFPALQGAATKMSSSDASSSIHLTDTYEQIRDKVTQHAHVALGDPSEDVACSYLRFFCEDEEKYQDLAAKYEKGEVGVGELQEELIEVLGRIVSGHQQQRAVTSDDTLAAFTKHRPLTTA